MTEDTPVEIDTPTMGSLEVLVQQWVDLATDQREYGSHLRTEANRQRVRETLSRQIALSEVRVGRIEDRIVGFVTFTIAGSTFEKSVVRGLIQNIYVVPEMRGMGIGTRLLEAAETALQSDGADVLSLDVMAPNEDARRFYDRHGYDPHRVTLEKRTENDTS